MKLFFKIFRPLDPIVLDGSNISEYNIANKLYNFLKVTLIDFDISRYTLIELFNLVKGLIVTFFVIIYLPISALFYLFNYRFLWINTWQLGAYLQQLDCIIKENELRKNSKLIFLCPKFLLINNFTHKFYKRKLILIENFIIYILLYPCMHTFFLQKTNWEYETVKKKSKFNYLNFNYKKKYKKYFTVKTKLNNENLVKKKISAKLNVSNLNRVIVVQQRDEFFYKSPKTRNSNINNLYDSINFLLRLNFTVVRYKSSKSKSLNISNKSYQEFLINNDMDKLEQFILIKNCKLVICYQGGILGYDYICNTPFLLINAIPLNINPLIKNTDRLIFKKYFLKNKKKLLSLTEITKRNLHLNTQSAKLKKLKIDLIENDSNEILSAVKEMIYLKKMNKFNKNKINKFFPNNISFRYSDAKISNSFIKKNIHVFK